MRPVTARHGLRISPFVILEGASGASAFGDPTQRLVEDTIGKTEPSAPPSVGSPNGLALLARSRMTDTLTSGSAVRTGAILQFIHASSRFRFPKVIPASSTARILTVLHPRRGVTSVRHGGGGGARRRTLGCSGQGRQRPRSERRR